jgi:hypothetical protein
MPASRLATVAFDPSEVPHSPLCPPEREAPLSSAGSLGTQSRPRAQSVNETEAAERSVVGTSEAIPTSLIPSDLRLATVSFDPSEVPRADNRLGVSTGAPLRKCSA